MDLIAALVEGRLEDEAEANALVASSPAHQAEYVTQKLAYEALAGLPAVELSEHERAALRRDVWTELQSQPLATASGSRWHTRWAGVAAGLFVVAGLVAVLGTLGGDDDATVVAERGDNGAAAATTVAAQAEDITESDDFQTEELQAGDQEGADTGSEPGANGDAAAPDAELADIAAALKAQPSSFARFEAAAHRSLSPAAVNECIETAGLEEHDVAGQVEAAGLVFAVAIPDESDLTTGPISFVRLDTCELAPTE